MTQPAQPAQLDAHTRLAHAIRDLCEPARELLDRADPILDAGAAELLADDRATERELEARHARYLRARQHGQVRRALAQLIDHRHRAARRRALIAAADTGLVPALLDQLQDGTASSSNTGGGSAGPYRSVIAAAAVELVAHIQRTVGHGGGPLTDQVRTWADHAVDVPAAADCAQGWADAIRTMLNPPKRWHHSAACPDCGHSIAHIPDDSGQLVRSPALEFDVAAGRARCLRCPARWTTVAQLRALGKVLDDQHNPHDPTTP